MRPVLRNVKSVPLLATIRSRIIGKDILLRLLKITVAFFSCFSLGCQCSLRFPPSIPIQGQVGINMSPKRCLSAFASAQLICFFADRLIPLRKFIARVVQHWANTQLPPSTAHRSARWLGISEGFSYPFSIQEANSGDFAAESAANCSIRTRLYRAVIVFSSCFLWPSL